MAVAGNIAFNALYQRVQPDATSIATMSERHPALFTPAGYAFSIWGIIYAAFVAYAIYQLLPRTYRNAHIQRVSTALLFASALASLWIVLFTHGWLGASVLVMLSSVALGMVMWAAARVERKWWLELAFSLYFGWVSVAMLASLATWMVANDANVNALGEEAWTALLLLLAGAAAAWMALRYDDAIFAAVVSWAAYAIHVANRGDDRIVALTALLTAVVVALLALRAAVRRFATERMRHLLERRAATRAALTPRSSWHGTGN